MSTLILVDLKQALKTATLAEPMTKCRSEARTEEIGQALDRIIATIPQDYVPDPYSDFAQQLCAIADWPQEWIEPLQAIADRICDLNCEGDHTIMLEMLEMGVKRLDAIRRGRVDEWDASFEEMIAAFDQWRAKED